VSIIDKVSPSTTSDNVIFTTLAPGEFTVTIFDAFATTVAKSAQIYCNATS